MSEDWREVYTGTGTYLERVIEDTPKVRATLRVPNPRTGNLNVRCPVHLREAFKAKAYAHGKTMRGELLRLMWEYVATR